MPSRSGLTRPTRLDSRFGRRSVAQVGAVLVVAVAAIVLNGRFLSPAEAAAVSVMELLRATMIAASGTAYQGTRVEMAWSAEQATGSVATVFHAADGKSRVEYQAAADGSRRVVIDDGYRVWDIDIGKKRVIVGRSADNPDGVDETLKLVAKNYNMHLVGETQIAGRSAYLVQLDSKYLGRRSQRLWIDRYTHLTLRSEKYRRDGSLASVSYFTDISFPKTLDPGLFVASVPSGLKIYEESTENSCVSPDRLEETVGFAPYVPAVLPAGFRFAGANITSSRVTGDTVHLRFTDGLDVISLFETRVEPGSRYSVRGAREVPLARGTGFLIDACDTLVLSWSEKDIYFALVGDMPVDVMRAIADSITR